MIVRLTHFEITVSGLCNPLDFVVRVKIQILNTNESPHKKSNKMNRRKQRGRSAVQ